MVAAPVVHHSTDCRREGAGPGYRKVPGVIYARRYRVHEGTSGYTTVYEFESTAVPESAAWKEQQQQSSPHSPRMRQAMTHARGRPASIPGLIPNRPHNEEREPWRI